MKLNFATKVIILVMIIIFTPNITKADNGNHNSFFAAELSLSYSSVYWWRGVEFYGDGVGVFWSGINFEIADTNLYLNYTIGFNEDWFTAEDSTNEDKAKELTEMDYGITYLMNLNSHVSLQVYLIYFQYPFYKETSSDNIDPSFIESSISLAINTILSPTINFYYDYYIEESDNNTPRNEDYYITFSFSHNLIETENNLKADLSTFAGYYNNAYLDLKGWSDLILSLSFSQEYKDISFFAGFNYARTLSKDFRRVSGVKNHFWADFGLSCSY